jgi:hypothetical protein
VELPETCTRKDGLLAGTSYPAIAVTCKRVRQCAANTDTVSGGGSATAGQRSYDNRFGQRLRLKQERNTSISDVQLTIRQALGLMPPANDLNRDGACRRAGARPGSIAIAILFTGGQS